MALPEKRRVLEAVVARLGETLGQMTSSAEQTRKDATHEEAKPENDKDTRALEQSYVARGQAQRVEELRAGLADVRAMPVVAFTEGRPAALGALVVAEENDRELAFFIAQYGGGVT